MDMLGSKRGKRAGRRLSMPEVAAAFRRGEVWTGVGLVWVPTGGSAHYEIDEDVGVLVCVQLMPSKQPVLARLGGLGGGGTYGAWRIPPVGTEVALIIPGGDLDGDALIVGTLSSGGVPDELDEDTFVVKAPKVVIIADDHVEIGQQGLLATDELVHGTGIDTFTGATYKALQSTASSVRAKK